MKNKLKLVMTLGALLTLAFLLPHTSQAVMQWSQANSDGFGDSNNTSTPASAVFNNQFYAGTYNTTTGTEVWRTSNGTDWTQVNDDGFSDSNNGRLYALGVFNNQLYAGTYNTTTGTEVWRTSNGTDWTQVNDDGFGDSNNISIYTFSIFNNQFYAGTYNSTTGTEVWRTSNGTDWTQVNTDGFGDSNNKGAYKLYIFNSQLYAGTHNTTTGTEVWRTSNGTDWTQVNDDGFGDANNLWMYSFSNFNNQLYAGTTNTTSGGEVWRTSNGTDWTQANSDGFGDSNNKAINNLIIFNNQLYSGTFNSTTGVEVWSTSNGTSWSQVNEDGFSDSNNSATYSLITFGGQLYAGTSNSVSGTELWTLADITNPTITNQSPEASAFDVGINTNIYLEVDDTDMGIDSSTLNVTIEGTSAILDGSCQTGYSCAIASDSAGGYNVIINPDTNFSYNQQVNVSTSVSDLSGNNTTSSSWFFTTEVDNTDPTITSLFPVNNSSDTSINSNISFSSQDNESGINSTTINVTVEGDTAISSGSCQRGYYCNIEENNSGGYDVLIDPNSSLSYGTEINISATAQDNASNSTTSTWSFTTASSEPTLSPKILTTSGPGEVTRLWAYDRHGNVTDVKIDEGLFPSSYLGGAGIVSIDQNNNGVKDQFVIFALSEGGPQARVMSLESNGNLTLNGQMFLFQNPDDEIGTSSIRDGLSVTSGDFDNDGYEDDVAACLTGDYNPHVKVFKDATGVDNWELINQFDAPFGANGCNLGTFQYDDEATELLVTPHHGPNVKPMVYVYTVGGTLKSSFQAYDDPINQGLTASGIGNRIYTTPNNGTSHVRVFDKEGNPKNFWWAYQEEAQGNFRNVPGDIDLDGKDEILISPVGSNGPHILSFESTGKWRTWPNFFAFDDTLRNGVGVAVIENWYGIN